MRLRGDVLCLQAHGILFWENDRLCAINFRLPLPAGPRTRHYSSPSTATLMLLTPQVSSQLPAQICFASGRNDRT